jgi:hypothetical protein
VITTPMTKPITLMNSISMAMKPSCIISRVVDAVSSGLVQAR